MGLCLSNPFNPGYTVQELILNAADPENKPFCRENVTNMKWL
jgi:hypothetical protein